MTGKKKDVYVCNFRLTLPLARLLKKKVTASGLKMADYWRQLLLHAP